MVSAAPLDGVSSHSVDVQKEILPMPRGDIKHGAIGRDRVFDGLTEVPFLRRNRIGKSCAWQLFLRDEWNLDRRGTADHLGQQPDHVVKVNGGSQPAVPPGRVV